MVVESTQRYRLVAVDLDGTLLNSKGRLSGRSVAALNAVGKTPPNSAVDSGAAIVIATGRPASAVTSVLQDSGLQIGEELDLVCYNGAATVRMTSSGELGEVLCTHHMDSESVMKCIDFCVSSNANLVVSCFGQNYTYLVNSSEENILSLYESFGEQQQHRCSSLQELKKHASDARVLKVLLLTKQQEKIYSNAVSMLDNDSIHVISAEMHLEMLRAGVNKGAALEEVCGALGLNAKTEMVSFGDNHNDLEMFAASACSYAMPNGAEKAVLSATQVCEWDNDEDGVARTLEGLLASGTFGAA